MGKQISDQSQPDNQISPNSIGSDVRKKILKEQDSKIGTENTQSNLECSICYSPIIDQGKIISCHHTFCFQCIKIWASQNLSCPQCRSDFTKVKRIQKNGCLRRQKIYTFKQPLQIPDFQIPSTTNPILLLTSVVLLMMTLDSDDELN